MKRITLLLSVFLWVFAVTGQSFEMDPQDYEKMQQINLAEREAAKHSFEQTKRSTAIPAQKDIFTDYGKGLTYPGNINVIIVSPDVAGTEPLRAALDGYSFITATSFPPANLPSLSVADLAPYDVLITFNNNQWLAAGGISPAAVGDIFAAYIDQGGLVVENSYLMDYPGLWAIGGNYLSGNYSAFTVATTDFQGSFTLGTILEAGHPLLTDVNSLAIASGLIQDNQAATGATAIAQWDNGQLLLAAKPNLVSMNLLPLATGAFNFTGDGVTLYANSAAWLMMNLADPDAPAAPTALTATAADLGVLEVALAWTNPSETFDGGTLTELTEVRVLRNGELIHTVTTPTIGGAVTYTDDDITAAGTYSYSVYGVNTDGEGPAASVSVYVGEDVPAAPEDVTLVAQGNDGHVSWTAPTEGLNGGYISGTDLTYTLVRMPGAVEVATDITAVEFTDTTVPGIGNYYYTVTVSNAIGEGGFAASNVVLLGAEGILLYETFDYEIGTIPPGWTVEAELDPDGNNAGDGMVNWAVRNFSTAGGTAPQMRFTWNPRFEGMSRLITGPIDTDGNSELRLRFNQFLSNFSAVTNTLAVRVSFDGGDTWTDLWTHAIVGNIPAQVAELYIDVPAGKSTMHLAWEFNGDAYQINNWDLDNIILEPVLENDLVALSISGNTTPSEGIENMYTIAVQNAGTATQSDYTVKLMKEGGVEIASVAGTAIEFGETLTYELPWTPAPGEPGPTYLYGYVDFAADELPGNNQTANLNVVVQPGDIIVITIGTGTNYPNVRMPFDFFWRNSLIQSLYYPDEIGMGGGVITGVQYTNNFVTDLPQKDIRIWIGETELDDLAGGWVDPTSLQLVFDGAVNFPSGENNIFINFDDIYIYTGGNLVVYTQKVWEQDYYSSNDRFYGTEDPGSNRTRRVAADGTAGLDPMTPTGGAASNWHPNTSLYFSTAGLGALEGTVTDGTDPVEGVLVRVLGTMATTHTDADGFYEFPYLLPETYNIEFSKFGYETNVVTGVVIEEDETTVQDAVIEAIPQFTVTGIVEGNDGILQEGAMVSLTGYDVYTAMTEADGSFEIEDVFEGPYTLTVVAAGYELYVDETVEVDGADLDLGTITVIEVIVPPANLQVDVDGQDEGNALLTWSDVAEREFRYDDGTATGQLGSGGGTLNTVLGSAHRKDAVLQEMSWYLTAEGGPHNTVKVWVFGLDANGNPNPQDVLYQMAGVPNTDLQWNTYEFTTPVEASNGFLIGLSYAGFLGIGTDAGTSTDWPFMPNSNFFVANYTTGQFAAIEGLGAFPFNFLIRAFGVDNGAIDFGKEYADHGNAGMQDVTYSKLPEPVVTGFPIYNNHNSIASKAFTGYNVFLDGDQVATEITEMEYLFEDLDEGTYTAGVQSVYTTGTSDIITVDFQMVFGVPATFTVTTNSGDSPEGAHVLLTNQDHDQYVYEHTVGADGVAHFETVRKGMYTLHVTHELFHDYIVENIDIQDEFAYTAELVEIIVAPYGLMVETEGLDEGDAHFSWNNVMGWSESFEGGVLPVGWDQIITNTGSQAGFTSTWHITGTVALTTPIVPQDGDYQAFMMWSYNHQDEWLITPEFTAPMGDLVFWYNGTNGSVNQDNYYVKASTDGGDTWSILWNASDLPAGANAYATPAVIDLSAYAGQDIHIAWNNVDGPGNDGLWYAWAIDNISVGGEKIDVRDLMVFSNPQEGNNDAARDGKFVKPVTIDDMNYNFAQKAFVGYNVFLNGAEVASEVTTTEHMFTDLPHGTHTAGVQSVYTSGVSEIMTIDFDIEIEMPEFARAQIIHNSADLAASEVDIFVNGEIFVEGLAFRNATPFVDVPAEVELTLDVAPANAGIEASVFNFTVTFDADETYVIVANGIVSATGYDPAPAFTVYPFAPAREAALNADQTDLLVFHGATDAPEVSVWAMGGESALFNFEYGEFAGYLSLPTADYVLEVRTADGETVVASYQAPLATLELDGAALTVVASGFLNPDNNSNGPAFGLWVATNIGGALIQLPLFTNINDLTGEFTDISLFPNPVRNMVNLVSTQEMQQVRVFDISGRVVYSNIINSEEYQINTEHLESGMYFVRITTAKGIFTGKLQVQK
ncbi:MAG: DUF4397 domain-containing protein [Bacteroidetes bacterium]|nr:MAG: DUF4397 domain-containing protein [Bacteroidota bacterium]